MPDISLKASDFIPTASVAGDEPGTIVRAENVVMRGPVGVSRLESYPGSKDLGENYNIDAAPVRQVETATVIAAAGITGNGYVAVTLTTRGHDYFKHVSVTVASQTTATLIVTAILAALNADTYLTARYTFSQSGPDISMTPIEAETNDATLNISIQNGTCTGITNGPTSANSVAGVAGFRLSGTIAYTAGSRSIVGTGTAFVAELSSGQPFIAGTEAFAVTRVTDDTHLEVERSPTTTASGEIARRLPSALFNLGGQRGVLTRGSAIQRERKDVWMVGSGQLYRNGVGTGYSATRKPKRLELNAAGSLDQRAIGFGDGVVPHAPTIDVVAGGTKGMTAGNYSFVVCFWNEQTDGHSNPCDAIKKDGAVVDILIAAGQRFRFDLTASLLDMPDNANGYKIFGSLSGGGVAAVNANNFAQGPWYEVRKVPLRDLDGSNRILIEYLDSEVGGVVTGDNDEPPECEWLTEFANVPFYVSALGKRLATNAQGTRPGSYVVPTKASNAEAAPQGWRVGVGDEITGFALGIGRLFCLTPSGLPFITPTGRTELGRLVPTLQDIPFTMRPYWTKGAISPYNILIVQGEVFSVSGSKPLRSPSGADERLVVPFEIGLAMEDLMKELPDGHYLAVMDPKNQQVCYIASAVEKNAEGYWVSRIFPLDLQRNKWMPPIAVSSTTRDMIVSAAAVVNNRLEFLAGGRVSGGTYSVGTFRYDELSGTAVPYYFAYQPTDNGSEGRSKEIQAIRVTGRVTDPVVQIHGSTQDGEVSLEDLEAGTNSLSGDIVLETTTGIKRPVRKPYKVRNLQLWSTRFSGTFSGTLPVDRVDEIVVEVETRGKEN